MSILLNIYEIYNNELNIFLKNAPIPTITLSNIKNIILLNETSFLEIPNTLGAYWITSTSPYINYTLNASYCKNEQCIYNGVSSVLRTRAYEHLLRKEKFISGVSAISIDLHLGLENENQGHTKRAWIPQNSKRRKVPKEFKNISLLDFQNKWCGSNEENDYLKIHDKTRTIWFNNGIDCINKIKHSSFIWTFYWLELENKSYLDFIEREWRVQYGNPKLCSYNKGR